MIRYSYEGAEEEVSAAMGTRFVSNCGHVLSLPRYRGRDDVSGYSSKGVRVSLGGRDPNVPSVRMCATLCISAAHHEGLVVLSEPDAMQTPYPLVPSEMHTNGDEVLHCLVTGVRVFAPVGTEMLRVNVTMEEIPDPVSPITWSIPEGADIEDVIAKLREGVRSGTCSPELATIADAMSAGTQKGVLA